MTIRETYTGNYDKLELFQSFQFLSLDPDIHVDKKHDRITFPDPDNARTAIVIDISDLSVQNGEITAGTVTEIHLMIKGKDGLAVTGLAADATTINDAVTNGVIGLYALLIANLDGNLIARGDKFDNIFDVGVNGKADLDAGGGNDLIDIWHEKSAVIDGGKGSDTIDFYNYLGVFIPADGVARVDLAKGTGTNPFGGTLKISNIENVSNIWNLSGDLRGDNHANILYGGQHVDTLMGRGGDDEIHMQLTHSADPRATLADGGTGKDTLWTELSEGAGAPSTGAGETLRFHNRLDLEHQDENTGSFHGGTFTNFEKFQVFGFINKDIFEFSGSDADEQVFSAGSDDPLDGRGGGDLLNGGGGADILTGGAGADKFQYQSLSDSTVNAGGQDTIKDFSHAEHDRIDLHLIFASQNFGGAYDFIGTDKFDGKSSEVRYVHDGDKTTVYVDDNADKVEDMVIVLDHGPAKLVEGDFLL